MRGREHGRLILAGSVGNILEWYDFAVYGYFAPVIARLFFPNEDPALSLIATFGIFAVGFFMRPVGALVIGHLGDVFGRKLALTLSVGLMAVPTSLMALLPTYETAGLLAPLLLTLLRLAQGLSVGGEYTGSMTLLVERAPPGRRGLIGSSVMASAVTGILIGSAVGAVVESLLTPAQIDVWGWRVPFALGLLLGLAGFLLRRSLAHDEAEAPKVATAGQSLPIVVAFREHGRDIGAVIAMNVLNGVGFYMLFVYMTTYLSTVVGDRPAVALEINTAAMVVLVLALPAFAHLSDKIGRRRVTLAGIIGLVLLSYPLFWMLHHPQVAVALAGQIGFALLLGAFCGPTPAYMSELFPRSLRCSAVSVAYNIPLAVFGGTTPMIAAWLITRTDADLSPAFYLSAAAVVSLVAVLTTRETYRTRLA